MENVIKPSEALLRSKLAAVEIVRCEINESILKGRTHICNDDFSPVVALYVYNYLKNLGYNVELSGSNFLSIFWDDEKRNKL